MLLFSINRSRGYENPSLDIIVTERCSIGGCPLEEAIDCLEFWPLLCSEHTLCNPIQNCQAIKLYE
jgi:hypothetical protein